MKKGKITIHDISKSLGIDSSTVSRALNDSPRVSKKTKERIFSKASELGYQRNSLASNLRTNKSNTIGVIVPRISRYFFSSVIAGIEEVAYEKGYDVVICQSLDNLEREKQLMQTLLSSRVDGILISISMETINDGHLQEYKKHGDPLIFFDRPHHIKENSNVIIDDYIASFDATEHLINNGCKNIVHFSGPPELELYANRAAGYMAALKKHRIAIRKDYIFESPLMSENGVEGAKKILELSTVDGVFSANDTAAISAMQYLKHKGIKIPEEIAFVGFGNSPVSAVIEPSLTTVNQSGGEMGKIATKLLIDQINKEKANSQNVTKVLAPTLIVRNSSSRTDNI